MSEKTYTTGRVEVTIQPCGNFLALKIPEKHRNVLSCQMTLTCSSDILTSNLLSLLQTCGITKESIQAELKRANLSMCQIRRCQLFLGIHKLGFQCHSPSKSLDKDSFLDSLQSTAIPAD